MSSRITDADSSSRNIDATGSEDAHAPQRAERTTVASQLVSVQEIHDEITALLDGLDEDLNDFLERFEVKSAYDSDWLKRTAMFLCKTAYNRQASVLKDLRAASNEVRENNVSQELEEAAAAVAGMATNVDQRLAEADAALREFGSKLPVSKQEVLQETLNRVRSGLSACSDDEAHVRSQLVDLRPSLQVLSFPENIFLASFTCLFPPLPKYRILKARLSGPVRVLCNVAEQSEVIRFDANWWAGIAEAYALGAETTSAEMQQRAERYANLYTDATVEAARQTHALGVIEVELDNVRTTAQFLDTPYRRFAVSELMKALSDVAPLRSRIAALYERQLDINLLLVEPLRELRLMA